MLDVEANCRYNFISWDLIQMKKVSIHNDLFRFSIQSKTINCILCQVWVDLLLLIFQSYPNRREEHDTFFSLNQELSENS